MPRKTKSQWEFAGDFFENSPKAPLKEPEKSPESIEPVDARPSAREDANVEGQGEAEQPSVKSDDLPVGPTVRKATGRKPAELVRLEKPQSATDSVVRPLPVADPKSADTGLRPALSVTDFTRGIKRVLEGQFVGVRLRGEVSNYRLQSSGHSYFVLKDSGAQMACVLFRSQFGVDRTLLKDGVSVVIEGDVTVYEPRGQYQLRVTGVEAEGEGALQAAFERLKKRLAAEGLFDPQRKQPLPKYPARIGIVTSPTGAAIRDVLHVIRRRFAGLAIVLAPVRVQGDGAALEIAAAIERMNRLSGADAVDVILVTRGGGSLEDLWAFNEEVVARAIVASSLPVVSAIGHEIDFTISDFVADLRAATPSAAAEILTAAYVAGGRHLGEMRGRLRRQARQALTEAQTSLRDRERRLARMHPRRSLERMGQQLDDFSGRLVRAARRGNREHRQAFELLRQRWGRQSPRSVLTEGQKRLDAVRARLVQAQRNCLDGWRTRVDQHVAALQMLSPLRVLDRGYSITFRAKDGGVVRSIADVEPGDRIRTRLTDGEISSSVEDRISASKDTSAEKDL